MSIILPVLVDAATAGEVGPGQPGVICRPPHPYGAHLGAFERLVADLIGDVLSLSGEAGIRMCGSPGCSVARRLLSRGLWVRGQLTALLG